MRKNVKEVYKVWRAGASKDMKSISTDGQVIKSYSTPILFRRDGELVLNVQHYSVTASCQQGALRVLLGQDNLTYREE